MSDKSISLESVLKEIRRFKGYIDDDMIERFSIAFKRLPPVELPMLAVEYIHISNRMLDEDYQAWDRLKFFEENDDADKATAWVKEWAREHPEKRHKTYAEDFFEKFPNAEPKYYDGRGKEQMIPIPCRQHCYGVVGQKCNGIGCSCSACWNAEMEGEE